MTWAIPNWYAVALLALAVLRSFSLLAHDTILNRPRGAAIRRLGPKFDEWLLCPWCAGAWLSVAWWLLWVWEPKWTLVIAVPFAISAIAAIIAVLLPD